MTKRHLTDRDRAIQIAGRFNEHIDDERPPQHEPLPRQYSSEDIASLLRQVKGGNKRSKRQLILLFQRQEGRCYYCNQLMVLSLEEPRRHQPMNPLRATLEHLDDRWSDQRGKSPETYRRVAACWKCNTDRGNARQAAQPLEVLHERSKRYPAPAKEGSKEKLTLRRATTS